MKQSNSRILIIGIDGGTWDVLAPACDRGWMPNLNRFRSQGCWGTLRSTIPPITPAAWVALMTGQNPGHHGVLGFQEYKPATNQVQLTSSKSIRTETLWQKLARHGKRVVVVGVPMTYPPLEVNGILVSGFEAPSIESEFTYPASFKEEILEKIPDFTFKRRYVGRQLKDTDNFAAYIKWLRRQSDQMVQILRMGMEKVAWDVSMVLLRSFDDLLHLFWRFIDFSCDTSFDPRNIFVPQYFHDLDETIGELLEIAAENEASVLLISDHGGQARLGRVYPNRILRKLGYLKSTSKWRMFLQRIQKRLHRRTAQTHPLDRVQQLSKMTPQINLNSTRAYVTEINGYADLYIQVKERQPYGVVDPKNVVALIDEISRSLVKFRGEDGEPVFKFVERPTKIYKLEEPKPNLPDLIIAPREGYNMSASVTGRDLTRSASDNASSGVHSLNGMFGIIGSKFKIGQQINAEIIDIAPTVLAALKLPVTQDMDGRVLKEVFGVCPEVTYEPAQQQDSAGVHTYSRKEKDEITSRLTDLGYL